MTRNGRVIVALSLGVLWLASRTTDIAKAVRKKTGVKLAQTAEVLRIRSAVADAWIAQGLEPPVITSSLRSTGAHGEGRAEDYRTRDLSRNTQLTLAADASRRVGWLYQFIVEDGTERWYYRAGVYEGYRDDKPTVPPHLHGEYDGGTT